MTATNEKDTIRAATALFVDTCRATVAAHYAKNLPTLTPTTLSTKAGRRYLKIIRNDSGGSRSVYGFVDLTNGNILKAATWKAPAKHARGNVLDASTWAKAHGPYGMSYLV